MLLKETSVVFDEVVDGELSAEGMRSAGETDVDATTE